jgi:fructose-6-phosphate aldolase 2
MQLILDTGNLDEIRELSELLAIDGVTTNPTLVSREGKDFKALIQEIGAIIGDDLPIHAQVISTAYEDIMEEAMFISSLRENMYVKIPVTPDGLRAIKELKKKGLRITATAIFTVHQGYLAAKAGADYVAAYVNRLDNISADGVGTVRDLVSVIEMGGYDCRVLAASFKNAQQVLELMRVGVHSVTVPYDIVKSMMGHPLTDVAVKQFVEDYEKAFGAGKKTNS